MNKKTHTKYYLAMGICAMIFLVTVVVVITTSYEDFQFSKHKQLSYRVNSIKNDIEYTGCVSEELSGFETYLEKEFDQYWQYAAVEAAYTEGILYARAINDTDGEEKEYYRSCLKECINKINDYLEDVDNAWMEEYAKIFLEILQSEL